MYMINSKYVLLDDKQKITIVEDELFSKEIGNITLPSGQIVVCDPFIDLEEETFLKSVPPGTYPVLLNIMRNKAEDERVAHAIVRFKNEKVVKWEMAIKKGENIDELEEDHFFGYGVDSATGCFMDKDTISFLLKYEEEIQRHNPDFYLYEAFEEEFDKSYKHTRSWLVTNFKEKASVALFSSGWGDGVYPSFWGLDENNEIICLVTDFMILDEEED